MPRNITVTFDDGSNHVYNNAPDDVTPEQIEARASRDFAGKRVTALDGGRAAPRVSAPARVPTPDIPGTPAGYADRVSLIPTDQYPAAPQAQRPAPVPQEERGLFSRIQAGVEVARSTIASIVPGGVGFGLGAAEGMLRNIASGKFGTQEGANLVEQTAAKRAQQFTEATVAEPPSALGREYAQDVGEFMQRHGASVLAGPLGMTGTGRHTENLRNARQGLSASIATAEVPPGLPPVAGDAPGVVKPTGGLVKRAVQPNPALLETVGSAEKAGLTVLPHHVAEGEAVRALGTAAGGDVYKQNTKAFTKALIKELDPDETAPRLDTKTFHRILDKQGKTIGENMAKYDMPVDDALRARLEAIAKDAADNADADTGRMTMNRVREILGKAEAGEGQIAGQAVRELDTAIGRQIRSNTKNQDLVARLRAVQDALRDAAEGQMKPDEAKAVQQARRRYAYAMEILPDIDDFGRTGYYEPGQLWKRLTSSEAGRQRVANERGGLTDLAKAGALVADRSGTGHGYVSVGSSGVGVGASGMRAYASPSRIAEVAIGAIGGKKAYNRFGPNLVRRLAAEHDAAMARAAQAPEPPPLELAPEGAPTPQAPRPDVRGGKLPVGEVSEGQPALPKDKAEKIPVGQVIEGQPELPAAKTERIPVGEATEIAPEVVEAAPERLPVGEAAEMPEPLPVGEVTENPIPVGEAMEFEHLPVGEATEITPETVEPARGPVVPEATNVDNAPTAPAGGGRSEGMEQTKTTHAGMEIQEIPGQGGEPTRWQVTVPETGERVSTPSGLDAAKRIAESGRKMIERSGTLAERTKAAEEARAAEERARAEAKKARGATTAGKSLAEIKAMDHMNRTIRVDGKDMKAHEFVDARLAAGDAPKIEMVDRVAPMSRTAFNRASNAEQRAHEAKVKAGGKKETYWLGGYSLSKTEYDYAVKKAAARQENTRTDPQPAPTAPAGGGRSEGMEQTKTPPKPEDFASGAEYHLAVRAWRSKHGVKTPEPSAHAELVMGLDREIENAERRLAKRRKMRAGLTPPAITAEAIANIEKELVELRKQRAAAAQQENTRTDPQPAPTAPAGGGRSEGMEQPTAQETPRAPQEVTQQASVPAEPQGRTGGREATEAGAGDRVQRAAESGGQVEGAKKEAVKPAPSTEAPAVKPTGKALTPAEVKTEFQRQIDAVPRFGDGGPETITLKAGGSTVKLQNTARRVAEYMKALDTVKGGKTPKPKPDKSAGPIAPVKGFYGRKPTKSWGEAANNRAPLKTITDMIDDFDSQAAVDFAAAQGIDLEVALKDDRKRLDRVRNLKPTPETP